MTDQTTRPLYDVARIRADFPILATQVRGKPLVYLDNAASSQKPRQVLDAERAVYETGYANVHRGVHYLSEKATQGYEAARETVRAWINAASTNEIVFTRGTTESINLVAHCWGRANLRAGDEILITHLEHHSNIVPWQMIAETTGARLVVAPVDDRGEVDQDAFDRLISSRRVKVMAVAHVSNALGTILPVRRMIEAAHKVGAIAVIDGAQALPHLAVDVQALDADFYAMSSHKAYGPTGFGVLYGKLPLLKAMPPWQGGGDMIETVTFEKTTYAEPPAKFEAGTPHIVGAIGFAAALDYIAGIGVGAIAAHEHDLTAYAHERLCEINRLKIIGEARDKAGVVSFTIDGIHPHDIGTILDQQGVAVRTGHHCTQPLMVRFGVPATARASFGMYNTRDEVDALVDGLRKVVKFMG
ncbi:cysteine desulfurase [Tistrella bauzanensis]|uniref:cysteine desulfurase n=1 Tax=Tistrella bauzanensis TaxID=657419 RepID=A0ABQ1IG47_9PROT|nr:cysteine desulfurase [Tistrella bauzanensis]GGB39529.1 cysteine desulfurase [Tistrella bauzanensis]